LIKLQANFDGEATLRRQIGMVVCADGGGEAEMLDLPPICVCGNAEPSRRWQSSARQRRQIRCFRADSICVGAIGGSEGKNESGLHQLP
jgi:hypothetical protein